jgi:hypothetical protein
MQVQMRFVDASASATLEGADGLSARANIFEGRSADDWHVETPIYRKVAYRQLYRGIDLFYGEDGARIKSEFLVTVVSMAAKKGAIMAGRKAPALRLRDGLRQRSHKPKVAAVRVGFSAWLPCGNCTTCWHLRGSCRLKLPSPDDDFPKFG